MSAIPVVDPGTLMLIIYLLIGASQIGLRRQLEQIDPASLSLRMWLFPWLSNAVRAGIVILAAMAMNDALASQPYSSLVVTALCLGLFVLLRRQRPVA